MKDQNKYVLVLIPGLDGTGILFQPLKQITPCEIETIVVEYPRNKIITRNQLVSTIEKQIPKDKPIVIVAESFGGALVVELLSKTDFNLKAVVFCASFARNPKKSLLWLSNFIPLSYLLRLSLPHWLIRYCCLDKNSPSLLISMIEKSIKSVNPSVLANRLRSMNNVDVRNKTAQLTNIPCSFIQASKDKLVSKRSVLDFKKAIPNITVSEIKGPHFILQTNPEECWRVIREYLVH